MRKIFILIIIIISLLIGFYAIKNRVGDIRPALLPVKSQPVQNSSITPVDIPLVAPTGYTIGFFAKNLGGIRDLEFSPGETLLASIPSSGKVVAIINNDGETKVQDILTGLNNPHGIAFYNSKLFVAEETRLVRYNWDEQNLRASQDKVLFDLPEAGNHFTRSIVFDGSGKLYASVGSTCNVCREPDPRYAAVLISDAEGTNPRIFAKGLRNSVFMALNPETGEVWATDMGRDFLGDNLPPDEINIVKEGKDYGWPDCYGNKIPDTNFNPNASCTNTEPPIYEIPAHSAPLGLTFINSSQFPNDWQGNLLVAYHGSWNRSVPDGYKVVHMRVQNNQILNTEDFITGFLQGSQTIGRPVDLVFDRKGNLYISDDKNGAVYIVGKNN